VNASGVAIAALLAQQARLCLLDEPLAHLDLNHQIATLELLSQRARRDGMAFVMVLHDPNFALRFCDRALLLFGDGTQLAGPVADVLDEANLTRLYGYPMGRVVTAAGAPAIFVPR
jgi:iron complex transport system ATP-binding protein